MIFQSRVTTLFLALFLLVETGPNPACGNQRTKSSSAVKTSSAPNSNLSSTMTNETKTVWGGPHVHITALEKTAEIEFDCAHGEIKGSLKGDVEGPFDLPGTFSREGGPTRADQASGQPARYSGRIEGDKMTLTVTLTESNEKLDEFTLTKGSQGRLRKCG